MNFDGYAHLNFCLMLQIATDEIPLLLEAIEELLYRIALRMEELKGGPMTEERRELILRQRRLEALQHRLLQSGTHPHE